MIAGIDKLLWITWSSLFLVGCFVCALDEPCSVDADCVQQNTICWRELCSCRTGYGSLANDNTCNTNLLGTAECGLCIEDTCTDVIQEVTKEMQETGLTAADLATVSVDTINNDHIALFLALQEIFETNLGVMCNSYGDTAFGCECCDFSGEVPVCPFVEIVLSGGVDTTVYRCHTGFLGQCLPTELVGDNLTAIQLWCDNQQQTNLERCEMHPSSTISNTPSNTPSPSASASSALCPPDQQPPTHETGAQGVVLRNADGSECTLSIGGECLMVCDSAFTSTISVDSLTVTCYSGRLGYDLASLPFVATFACETTAVCLGWRNTGDCSPDGPREPQWDKLCNETIPLYNSGYCECIDRTTHRVRCGFSGGNDRETTCQCECQEEGGCGSSSVSFTLLPWLGLAAAVVVSLLL